MEQCFLQSYIRQMLLYKYIILILLILTPTRDKLARVVPKPMLLCRSKIVAQSIKVNESGNIQILARILSSKQKV